MQLSTVFNKELRPVFAEVWILHSCQGRQQQVKMCAWVQHQPVDGAFGETPPVNSTETPVTFIMWVLITSYC